MNREDIIRLAQEAWGKGKVYCFDRPKYWLEVEEMFVRFANLVSAAEREACAKVCDEMHLYTGFDCADAIRARLSQCNRCGEVNPAEIHTCTPNEFNPDWSVMAVMVEEQQRMAKRIEELEAALKEKNA